MNIEFGYFATLPNKLCEDTNDVPVLGLQTCKEATKKLEHVPGVIFESSETLKNFPRGCFVHMGYQPNHVHFNMHIDGHRHRLAAQVCENRSRKLYYDTDFVHMS